MKRLEDQIVHLGRISSLQVGQDVEHPSSAVAHVLGDLEIYLPGLIDPEKERDRLIKQREKLEKDEQKSRSRLDNEQFMKRAPAEVVEAEKKKLGDIRTQLDLIDKNLKAL